MKNKKIALYNPYLDILGGGEKYSLSILKALEDEGFHIYIFWNKNLQKDFQNKFSLKFKQKITFLPDVFSQKTSLFEKISATKQFDIFLYVTNGSYFFSGAKKNFVYAMIPKKDLYRMDMINKLKTWNYRFITHSQFNQKQLKKWQIDAKLLYFYLDDEFIKNPSLENKEKIILSVGRFFSHLHSKRQDLMIKTFKDMKKNRPEFKDFKLILAGGLDPGNKDYFNNLVNIIGKDPTIILKPNLSFKELLDLYRKSLFYWHFAGFGINEDRSPELVEHFGISPLEAMASGCLTFCYRAGGPKEVIDHKQNGFLFKNESDLVQDMIYCLNNPQKAKRITENGQSYVKRTFNYSKFKLRIKKIFT